MLIYPLFSQIINGNKLLGRVLGKYVSTNTKAAGNVSIIKFNGQSKVDKLYEYCKKQQLHRTNVIINRKVYNLLYDKNIYILAYEMLKKEFHTMLILTAKDIQNFKQNIIGCLLLYPSRIGGLHSNLLPSPPPGGGQDEIISEIITQIKAENYKLIEIKYLARKVFTAQPSSVTRKCTTSLEATIIKDILVIKAIVIILEAIYAPSFSSLSRQFRPSFNLESALKDVKVRLKDAKWYIKGDISKCFDFINFNVLMSILEEKIKDRRFTGLI